MLQAKANSGKLITLATLTKTEIYQIKEREEKFYCPVCGRKVIMKTGSKMIPHFAHQSIAGCPSHEGGEGVYHERGKLLLYQWLSNQQLDIKLEAYLPEIKQRPDLLLTLNGRRIAIEYQCARIPVDQITKRNIGYMNAGIIPIWIIGASRLKRQTKTHIKVDQFILHFIHQFSATYPLSLFFFCPYTFQFITVQDLYFTKEGQAAGKINASRLKQISLQAMLHPHSFQKHELYQLWKKEKQHFRLGRRDRLYGKQLAWHQWLYLKGTHLEYLPSIIHLPIVAQYRMKSPTWNWQSRLSVDLLHPLPLEGKFSIKSCEHLLRDHLHQFNPLPLIASTANPIAQYLQKLAHLNILKQLSANHYQKIKAIHFHKNIEESLLGDEAIINQLQQSEVKQNTSMFCQ